MRLSKKQKKLWTVLVIVAGMALILTSMIPFFSAILR